MLQHKEGKTSNRHPLSAPCWGLSWSLKWGESRDGPRGWTGGLPTHWCCYVQGECMAPYLCPWFIKSGSWVFAPFVSYHSYFAPTKCTQLFSVPSGFFVSAAQGDICPGASTAAKGHRSEPLSRPSEDCGKCAWGSLLGEKRVFTIQVLSPQWSRAHSENIGNDAKTKICGVYRKCPQDTPVCSSSQNKMMGWEDIAAEHNVWIPIKARGSASFES